MMALGRLSRAWRSTTHRPALSKNKTRQNHHHLLREGPMSLLIPAGKYCPYKLWNFFFLKSEVINLYLTQAGYQKQDAIMKCLEMGIFFREYSLVDIFFRVM